MNKYLEPVETDLSLTFGNKVKATRLGEHILIGADSSEGAIDAMRGGGQGLPQCCDGHTLSYR